MTEYKNRNIIPLSAVVRMEENMGIVVKNYACNQDGFNQFKDDGILRYDEPVIKRYRIKYTVPEMVRFGMLPYSALEEYERRKNPPEEVAEPAVAVAEEKTEKVEKAEKAPRKNRTFWEDDEGDRKQLSEDEYEKFLREHSISLSQADDVVAQMLANQN